VDQTEIGFTSVHRVSEWHAHHSNATVDQWYLLHISSIVLGG